MGSSQSKVSVEIPDRVFCFPSFGDENLRETVEKIGECHMQAVQLASVIGSLLGPTSATSHVVFSAASVLFTYIIHRLSPEGSNNNAKGVNMAPKENESHESNASDKAHNSKQDKTLEDALIEAKVSIAVANKSVRELLAKICIIQHRYERLASAIPRSEKRLEVVPAVQTCEEMLHLFHDPAHVFQMHPLISAPLVIPFAGIFVAIAEISFVLIPSYKDHLIKEMNLLTETLQSYKTSCFKARLESVKLKSVKPTSMLDAVASGMSELNYRMEDTLAPSTSGIQVSSTKRAYEDANVAISVFREELEQEYENMFIPVLDTVSKFTGYFHDPDGSDSPDSDKSFGGSCSSNEDESKN